MALTPIYPITDSPHSFLPESGLSSSSVPRPGVSKIGKAQLMALLLEGATRCTHKLGKPLHYKLLWVLREKEGRGTLAYMADGRGRPLGGNGISPWT